MAELIIGIVGDILGHVAIKGLKRINVGLTYRTGRTNSAQFVILLPGIDLGNFGRSQESRIATSPFESLPLRSWRSAAALCLWSSTVHWLAAMPRLLSQGPSKMSGA